MARLIKEVGAIFIVTVLVQLFQDGLQAIVGENSWVADLPNIATYLFVLMVIVWVLARLPAFIRYLQDYLTEPLEDPLQKLRTEIHRDEVMIDMSVDKAKVNQQRVLSEKRIADIKPLLCDLQVNSENLAHMVIGIAKKVDYCNEQAALVEALSTALSQPEPEHKFIAHLAGQLANSRYSALTVADVAEDNKYWRELIIMLAQYQGTLTLYGDSYQKLGAATLRKVQELEQGFMQLKATTILAEVKLPIHKIDGALIKASEELELKLRAPDATQLEAGIAILEG